MPFFSIKEQRSRIERVRRAMRTRGVDCAITFSFQNSYYLSGVGIDPWGNYATTILPIEGEAVLIVPLIDKERAEENSWIKDIRAYAHAIQWEQPPLNQVLMMVKQAVVEKGLDKKKIGIELSNHYDRLSHPLYCALKNTLPHAEFVDISEILEPLRLVLSDEEIQMLRIAGENSVVGMKALVDAAGEGISEKELAAGAFSVMEKELAKKHPEVETVCGGRSYFRVTFGRRTLHVHGGGTGKSRLRKGDLIMANAIHFINGYMSSLERTIAFRELSDKQRRVYEVMVDAREKGISMFRPGVKCSDIYKITRKEVERRGYGKYLRHTFGHSHGILNWLSGWLNFGNITAWDNTILREGIVISMLLGIYVPELGGFRHGDMFLITKDGHENLTDFENGIITI